MKNSEDIVSKAMREMAEEKGLMIAVAPDTVSSAIAPHSSRHMTSASTSSIRIICFMLICSFLKRMMTPLFPTGSF